MRIIEPKRNQRINQKKQRKQSFSFIVVGIVIFVGFGIFVIVNSLDGTNDLSSTTSTQVAGTQNEQPQLLTGDQFLAFYESFTFPNTQEIEVAPVITGHTQADERIRQIAESRGYVLRSVPVLPIKKLNQDDLNDSDLLQPKAYTAWRHLERRAKQEGHGLILTSAYRSIDSQRQLFLGRLGDVGRNPGQIASGQADQQVVAVLQFASPPGYSRHHTGYTIDLRCDGYAIAFERTPCYGWLKQDNFNNAKQSGWIPSYPDGADMQGPEPEPWEFVWVGRQTLGL